MRGFTLLEVMVALLLAAATTASLGRSLGAIVQSGSSSSRQLAASWIARTAQEDALMAATSLRAGEETDVVSTGDGTFRRTVTIDEEGGPLFLRVTVSVGTPPVVVQTRVYRPWSLP